jgi:hypothetical protein
MSKLDVFDPDTIANAFGIATALVQEIEYINDEDYRASTPEKRFEVVRKWVVENIKPADRSGRELTTMTETTNSPTKPNEPACTECSRLASRVEELREYLDWKVGHASKRIHEVDGLGNHHIPLDSQLNGYCRANGIWRTMR